MNPGMTPEERDRLVRVEERQEATSEQLKEVIEKLDRLIAAAAMGKGAWWLIMKIGGVLVGIAFIVSAVLQLVHPVTK